MEEEGGRRRIQSGRRRMAGRLAGNLSLRDASGSVNSHRNDEDASQVAKEITPCQGEGVPGGEGEQRGREGTDGIPEWTRGELRRAKKAIARR